ncbi:MAG: MBL fold metallo-hydrolase, partial [Anaerolineae bacterium]|nr:MBL fold metallo-hydrolase [Anaerolineae bacterium]
MKNPYVWIMILMPFVALAGCRAAAPALPTSVEVRNTPPTSTQTPPPTATQAPPTPTFTVTPTRQPAPSPTSRPISDTVRITILYDNTSTAPELRAGWGFSALVEYHGHTVLFDAGADPTILKHNASQLNIDLAVIEAIVLSHIHQDHTGGLPAIDL